jgi:erythrin-vacuolar iron transport family protein
MAFSEGLSYTGEMTGRGNPFVGGAITGGATSVDGVFHTLPFLISSYHAAIAAAVAVIAVELVARLAEVHVLRDELRPIGSPRHGGRRDLTAMSAGLGVAAR